MYIVDPNVVYYISSGLNVYIAAMLCVEKACMHDFNMEKKFPYPNLLYPPTKLKSEFTNGDETLCKEQ